MSGTYRDFFQRVTGQEPLPFQERYASDPFSPTLLVAPTGLGKTWTVCVPWLHRLASGHPSAPRRQVIVLPRQNLTRQTYQVAEKLVVKAGLADRIRVLELMGGSSDNEVSLGPDEPSILVCTQDMYLSRALNRGYARRPPRWPIDFALLNNDCQLVFDEVQLMSDGLATSTQLAAFRERYGAFGPRGCTWMSATVNRDWLQTVDFGPIETRLRLIELDDEDGQRDIVQRRLQAKKSISPAPAECRTPKGCADFALSQHKDGTRTLIIANTVVRAREIWAEITRAAPGAVLIHSRFRPGDRNEKIKRLLDVGAGGQIIVATQVIEAGVDISSRLLITDVAPWGSLVQRFGRVNRYGEEDEASIWWVDEPVNEKSGKDRSPERLFAPYGVQEVERAVEKLKPLTSASPVDLGQEDGPAPWKNVLRRADLRDLFDTSSDLSGNHLDISRFIRSGIERDCYVFWRNVGEDLVPEEIPEASDAELCPAPISEIRDFIKSRRGKAWAWNYAKEEWESISAEDSNSIYPGMTLLARAADGGYTRESGWDPASKEVVRLDVAGSVEMDADSSDRLSIGRTKRQTLAEHTDRVIVELECLLKNLNLLGLGEWHAELRTAALRHDWGKAHPIMQETLNRRGDEPLMGKSEHMRRHRVPHFRHELASALAMVAIGDSDLAAYLVAAHHGKIRMGIRSMPGEQPGCVRGIRDGDELEAGEIATAVPVERTRLSLSTMKLGEDTAGRPSWVGRVLSVLERLGPFRLAYLEMLLRTADSRASEAVEETTTCQKSA